MQLEKELYIPTDQEQLRFLRMYRIHKPEVNICYLTKDELIYFASTHGHTINYSEEMITLLIDSI